MKETPEVRAALLTIANAHVERADALDVAAVLADRIVAVAGAAGLFEPPPARTFDGQEVDVRFLCEVERIFVKPDVLYRFEVDKDCPLCRRLDKQADPARRVVMPATLRPWWLAFLWRTFDRLDRLVMGDEYEWGDE